MIVEDQTVRVPLHLFSPVEMYVQKCLLGPILR
jgi:hypothetical protein